MVSVPGLLPLLCLQSPRKNLAPRLYSSYLFGLMLHQLHLDVSIIGMLNKLHHRNVSQDITFQINYITAIFI